MAVFDRVKSAWSAFRTPDDPSDIFQNYGPSDSVSLSRPRFRFTNERSIITSIYNRIATDAAAVAFRHAKLDDQDRFSEYAKTQLDGCLAFQPNQDQGPRAFRQDIYMTLFEHGAAAIVAVETTKNPSADLDYDVLSLRVGEIVKFHPKHVRIRLFNDETGRYQEVTLEKRHVGIVVNPFYSIMNESNSTLKRLTNKLNLLDTIDEQSGSGKIDIIVQLPFAIKSEARKQQAEERRKAIEVQLKDSQYGIAYADATEKITQLNRPAENNLLKQVELLTGMLYDQLGITEAVMNGTADEAAMLYYFNRSVEPLLDAVKEAMQIAFLGQMKIRRQERIMYFRDPFKLVPVANLAEIADKFTRNEVFSSNEMRGFMGVPPSSDPKADELRNSNMPQPMEIGPGQPDPTTDPTTTTETGAIIDEVSQALDEITAELGDLG